MSIVKIFAERGYSSTTFALKEISRDVKEKLRREVTVAINKGLRLAQERMRAIA